MSICLAGSHRTGKSTLAKAFAAKTGWTYLPSQAGQVFVDMGVKVAHDVAPELRLEIQEEILRRHEAAYSAHAGRPWISDRSPFDSAAYTVLDLLHLIHPRHYSRVLSYVERCFDVANRHCSAIVLVQPGIPFVAEEGKMPPNELFVEAMNTQVWGLLGDRRLTAKAAFIRRDVTDLQERLEHLMGLQAKLNLIGKALIPEGMPVN